MITRQALYGQHGQVMLVCDECDWATATLVQLADYNSRTHTLICPKTGSHTANGVPKTTWHE